MAGATKLILLRRRLFAIFGTAVFFLVTPGSVAGFVPWWLSQWHRLPPFFGLESLRWIGIGLILVGVLVVVEAFARFAWRGLGTPAPTFPTRRLVLSGVYLYVRNPMYCAIIDVILGRGFLFADARLFLYAALVWLSFHLVSGWKRGGETAANVRRRLRGFLRRGPALDPETSSMARAIAEI